MPVVGFENKIPRIDETAWIAESAVVLGDVEIGRETVIYPGAIIRGDTGKVTIGEETVVQDSALINTAVTPAKIGNGCLIGFGSLIHGAIVGNYCVVGASAVLMPGVNVGDESIIGACSFLPMMKRYEKRSVIAGIPADFKKEAKESDLKMWRAGAKTWKDLALRYKKAGLKI